MEQFETGDEFLYDFILRVQEEENMAMEDKLQILYKAASEDKEGNEGVLA